jgi:hypothetical protein
MSNAKVKLLAKISFWHSMCIIRADRAFLVRSKLCQYEVKL